MAPHAVFPWISPRPRQTSKCNKETSLAAGVDGLHEGHHGGHGGGVRPAPVS